MTPARENEIAERSYQIWEREGKPEGKHLQHWFQAISELEGAPATARPPSKVRRSPAAAKTRRPRTSRPAARKA